MSGPFKERPVLEPQALRELIAREEEIVVIDLRSAEEFWADRRRLYLRSG